MARIELYLELEPVRSTYSRDWVIGATLHKTRLTRPKKVENEENRWVKVLVEVDHEALFDGYPQIYDWLGVDMPRVEADLTEKKIKEWRGEDEDGS